MHETSPAKVNIRPFNQSDLSFIFGTWLNSYYYGSRFTEKIKKTIYFDHHHQIIQRIIDHPKTDILVACSDEDQNTIFGYLVAQDYLKPIIHYLYIKGPFQGFGIARELVLESGLNPNDCYFTHWTRDTGWVLDKYPEAVYNPYLIS